jgi:hypothetical protein
MLILIIYSVITFFSSTHAIQMTGVKSILQKNNTCKYANCLHPEKSSEGNSSDTEWAGESQHTRRYLQEAAVDLNIPITERTTDARVLLEMTVDPPGVYRRMGVWVASTGT